MSPAKVNPRFAIYVGTFDPLTYGHLDVIERGSKLFDRFLVAIGENANKHGFFSRDERLSMISGVCKSINRNIEVHAFDGLAVEFARKHQVAVMVRGLRTEADYVYEMQMAMMNRLLCQEIETVFIPTRQDLSHISSSLVKEIARLKGNLTDLVPELVAEKLAEKYKKE
jgi:pantetheine-phosphate adenylyltransferase